jgi:murein DD-endopeptidase MepM/ murein hydrolase activator NlpD
MIRHTRFAASLFFAALLAACAPRDDAPAPVSQHGPQSAPVAAVTPARLTPHPSSMPPALRAAAPTVAATSAGTTVVVQRGETLSAIARRHGVAATAIAQANNLKPPYGVQAGQKLTLPGVAATETFVAAAKPAPEKTKTDYRPLAVRAAPIPPPAAEPVSQITVASSPRSTVQAVALSAPEPAKTPTAVGDTLKAGPARAEPVKVEPARIDQAKVELAQAVRAEAARMEVAKTDAPPMVLAKAEPFAQPRPVVAADQHFLRLPANYGKPAAKADAEAEVASVPTAYKAMPKPTLGEPPPRAGRSFAWPVKGRVISSYGPQPGGLRNDGLNIAASRGEKVVAADNGVVAYAGGDLKGFGNLVLIKHAGGFVTTYAHNDKLMVQRGDKVKRGQVIATVGESGSVTQPQVHFQVRQGAHAVDPRPLMERS